MATLDQGVLPRALSLRTPGKINLTLEVRGTRADGYHDLRSIVVGVDLCDRVRVMSVERGGVSVDCGDARIDCQTNLARIAAATLRERTGTTSGVRVELSKRIPIGAGLGGGSSDAAATLRLCDALWALGLGDGALAEIGAAIGSDVPVFFSLPSAVMTGRGEHVDRLAMRWRGWVLLIVPSLSLSTREVYASWRSSDACGDRPAPSVLADCTRADELSSLLFNDLEPAAFRIYPQLRDLKDAVELDGGRAAHMTGSGSALFLLFDDDKRAATTAQTIEQSCPGVATAVVEAPVSCCDPTVEEF